MEKSSKVTEEYIDTLDQKIGYINEQLTILEDKNQKIQDESARAREQIKKEHQEMQDGIKDEIVEVAYAIAEKMVGREINKENNQDIIDEAIKKMDDNK